jgi:hypothetical protein
LLEASLFLNACCLRLIPSHHFMYCQSAGNFEINSSRPTYTHRATIWYCHVNI